MSEEIKNWSEALQRLAHLAPTNDPTAPRVVGGGERCEMRYRLPDLRCERSAGHDGAHRFNTGAPADPNAPFLRDSLEAIRRLAFVDDVAGVLRVAREALDSLAASPEGGAPTEEPECLCVEAGNLCAIHEDEEEREDADEELIAQARDVAYEWAENPSAPQDAELRENTIRLLDALADSLASRLTRSPRAAGEPTGHVFYVDRRKINWPSPSITGAQVRAAVADMNPAYRLVLEGVGREEDRPLDDAESYPLSRPDRGPLRFYSVPPATFGG